MHFSWRFKSVLVLTDAILLVQGSHHEELVLSTVPPSGERKREKEELACGTAGALTDSLMDRQHRLHTKMQEGIYFEPCLKVDSEVQPETQGIQETGELQIWIQETGELQIGIQETGELQTGIQETGELQTGIQETGEPQTGIQETGHGELQIGIQETGELQTGIQETGELQTGIQETGELQTGMQKSGET